MKKQSAYARKKLRTGTTFNGLAFINALQRSAQFGEAVEVAGFVADTESAADKAAAIVRGALESLMAHTPPANIERTFDALSHAVGIGMIRALQIEPDESKNPAIPIIRDGTDALRRAIERWESRKAFGLDAEGRETLPAAVDVYLEILYSSSPAQMEKASAERLKILKAQGCVV